MYACVCVGVYVCIYIYVYIYIYLYISFQYPLYVIKQRFSPGGLWFPWGHLETFTLVTSEKDWHPVDRDLECYYTSHMHRTDLAHPQYRLHTSKISIVLRLRNPGTHLLICGNCLILLFVEMPWGGRF